MAKVAAFFDLDRTLISDSSALLMVQAFIEAELMSSKGAGLAELTRRAYRVAGETWIGMQLTRRSIGRLAGWPVASLGKAARQSVSRLQDAVYPQARETISRHHKRGHVVCVATSTGREIVAPLCKALGADHLIASEYEQSDGVFTGRLVGPWIWGEDKAAAVSSFAAENDIDLGQSYAYSDSFFDRSLLEIVGNPRPVNPDPLLRAMAVRRGWPVLRFGDTFQEAMMNLELYDVLRPIAHPWLSPLRLNVSGLEHIPSSGPVILAANHRSYLDPVVLGFVASRRGRKLRYLGKKEIFDAPVLGQFVRAMGQIKVERGTGDDRPLREAIEALHRGEAIGIFPQGTIPRGEKFFDRKLEGRSGAVRLALATGCPIVPVGLWRTETVWPRSSRVPSVAALVRREPVQAFVGEPLMLKASATKRYDPATLKRLTKRVMDAISDLIPADVGADPTPAQIRKASPPS